MSILKAFMDPQPLYKELRGFRMCPKASFTLAALSVCLIISIVLMGCITREITISGVVTDYSSGEPLDGVEVSVYTYKQSVLDYLPPLGEKITTTLTDGHGWYELRVPRDYKRVVVFSHNAPGGWRVITLDETTGRVDLVRGAPGPMRVEEEKLLMITRKAEYVEGELVSFTIENICSETVTLRTGAPWRIQKEVDEKWENVFVPLAIQVITPLEPGEVRSWSWNQRGQYGNYTGIGQYRVLLDYIDGEIEMKFSVKPQ
jgi:hypothetical protein